jgi:hypothetical protein
MATSALFFGNIAGADGKSGINGSREFRRSEAPIAGDQRAPELGELIIDARWARLRRALPVRLLVGNR